MLDYDAYFFDFDGLLANTERLHFKAYQLMLEKRNLSLPWDFSTYVSFAHQKTEEFARVMYALFPSLYQEEPNWFNLREEKQKIYLYLLYNTPIELMPGVKEFLSLLARYQKSLYVVTNAPKIQIDAVLTHQPFLKVIPTWVTREFYDHPKPSSECYDVACKMHSKLPFKGIGFEDSIKGLEALEGSSLDAVLIYPSYYPKDGIRPKKSTSRFSSFTNLMETYHLSSISQG